MAIKCNICNKELDAFSGGRCRVCRSLVCKDCIASGGTDQKNGIICISCYEKQQKEKNPQKNTGKEKTPATGTATLNRRSISIMIIASFTLLCIFIYIIVAPYITTSNALRIVEFGPDAKLQAAKEDLASVSGSYVIAQLKELAVNGKRNTAIRAVYALGAQPNPEAVLILKELQLSDSCPEYLKSVIIEALMENSRLYGTLPATKKSEK